MKKDVFNRKKIRSAQDLEKYLNKNLSNDTQNKLEKMRSCLLDKEKCKEIAQKLCAYISSNKS